MSDPTDKKSLAVPPPPVPTLAGRIMSMCFDDLPGSARWVTLTEREVFAETREAAAALAERHPDPCPHVATSDEGTSFCRLAASAPADPEGDARAAAERLIVVVPHRDMSGERWWMPAIQAGDGSHLSVGPQSYVRRVEAETARDRFVEIVAAVLRGRATGGGEDKREGSK